MARPVGRRGKKELDCGVLASRVCKVRVVDDEPLSMRGQVHEKDEAIEEMGNPEHRGP